MVASCQGTGQAIAMNQVLERARYDVTVASLHTRGQMGKAARHAQLYTDISSLVTIVLSDTVNALTRGIEKRVHNIL